jgi:hypothetical protein
VEPWFLFVGCRLVVKLVMHSILPIADSYSSRGRLTSPEGSLLSFEEYHELDVHQDPNMGRNALSAHVLGYWPLVIYLIIRRSQSLSSFQRITSQNQRESLLAEKCIWQPESDSPFHGALPNGPQNSYGCWNIVLSLIILVLNFQIYIEGIECA